MQYLVHSVTVGLVNATMQQLGWSTRIRSPFWIEHSVLEDVTPWWPEAKRYRIWVKFLMCNSRKWKILHLWLVFLLPERRNNWKSDGNPHLGTVVIRGIKKMPWVHQGSQGGKYNVMFTDHLHHHRIHHASMKPSSPRAVPLPDCSPAKISCDPHHQWPSSFHPWCIPYPNPQIPNNHQITITIIEELRRRVSSRVWVVELVWGASLLLCILLIFPFQGGSPLIQQHFSCLQVLDVTPTQDAPCLPGTGSDDDGHPDSAPSSLPRHPTGECPWAPMVSCRPLVTPNSCIHHPPFLIMTMTKYFTPKSSFQSGKN